MLILCQKEYFKSMTSDRLDEWLKINKEQLIGSAIFTQNKSMTSKVVSWAEHLNAQIKNFVQAIQVQLFGMKMIYTCLT